LLLFTPQNHTQLTPNEVDNLRREVDKSLTKRCTDFLNAVFAALQKRNPQNLTASTNTSYIYSHSGYIVLYEVVLDDEDLAFLLRLAHIFFAPTLFLPQRGQK
jgi:hypothetical protein